MLKNIFQSHPNSELTTCYAEDWHLVVGIQIILDQLKFYRNLCQYFIHFLSPWPRLEEMLKWMSHAGLYTSPTPFLCVSHAGLYTSPTPLLCVSHAGLYTSPTPFLCDEFIIFFRNFLRSFTVTDLQSKHLYPHLTFRKRHFQKLLTRCRRPTCINPQKPRGVLCPTPHQFSFLIL